EEFRGVPERQYEYAMIEFKMTAKKILRYVRGNEYDNLKAEELQPMIEELETRFEAVKKAKETRKSTVPDVSSIMFPNNAEEFIKAAKALMRRVRDKDPFSDFERRSLGTGAGWMIEGSPDQVIDRYNKLIRSF